METIPNTDNLPSPTQARAGAVDTKVGKGELWGDVTPRRQIRREVSSCTWESAAGKERSVEIGLPQSCFYCSKPAWGPFEVVTPQKSHISFKIQLRLKALKKQGLF